MATESAVGVVDQTAAGVSNAVPVDVVSITTRTGTTPNRQIVALGDPTASLGLAPVDPNEGLSVSIANAQIVELLGAILAQLNGIAVQLNAAAVVSPLAPPSALQ